LLDEREVADITDFCFLEPSGSGAYFQISCAQILLGASIDLGGHGMQHQTQYWLTCPECGHQMEVGKQGGPLRAKYCEKCNLLFSFTNEELAVAENVETAHPVGLLTAAAAAARSRSGPFV
jgi:hypothetical protein